MEFETLEKPIEELMAWLEETGGPRFPSGFTTHDQVCGTFNPGSLNLIAARPGVGKTAFMIAMAARQGLMGIAPYFLSLEMPPIQVVARLFSSLLGIDLRKIMDRILTEEDIHRMIEQSTTVLNTGIKLGEPAKLVEIVELIRRSVEKKSHSVIFLDYIGLVSIPGLGPQEKYAIVSAVTFTLKTLARELECPIVAGVQLNRSVEHRTNKVPMLADLRDSGELENHADLVLGLYRPALYDSKLIDDEIQVTVLKNRNGPLGEYPLIWDKEFARVSE